MGSALYIVANKEIEDVDLFVDGKAIGKIDGEILDQACQAAGVESLLSFISQDPDELADFLEGEGAEMEEGGELPAEEWFTPAQGLAVVRGLTAYLQSNPKALPRQAAVLEDLADFERVFLLLADRQLLWHFAVDF